MPGADASIGRLPPACRKRPVRLSLPTSQAIANNLHQRFLRALHLTHLQFDEIRRILDGAAEAKWLWIACAARTKHVGHV